MRKNRLFFPLMIISLLSCEMMEPGSGAKAKKSQKSTQISESAASSCSNNETSVQVFYRSHLAPDGNSCEVVYQNAVCDNGVWKFPDSGVTLYSFCIEQEKVYPTTTVNFPLQCEKTNMRERTCQNGSCGPWQGQTGFTQCQQLAAADCDGTPHGGLKMIGYDTAILLNGDSCDTKKVQASCNNGQWISLTWTQGEPLYANCYDDQTDLGHLFNFLNQCQVDNSNLNTDQEITDYLAACYQEYKNAFYVVND